MFEHCLPATMFETTQVLVDVYTDKMRAKLGLQAYDAMLSTELMKLMWVVSGCSSNTYA